MTQLDGLVHDATVLTMDPDRRILSPGRVGIVDDRITLIEARPGVDDLSAAWTIDARGRVLAPGFVNAHCHATHNLVRGGPSDDRVLRDWSVNALRPALAAYSPEDVRTAARLYCVESVRSGITTTVDNQDRAARSHFVHESVATYRDMGIRVVIGDSFFDTVPREWHAYVEALESKEPGVAHDHAFLEDTGEALARIERDMRRYHGTADGRIQVWPEPCVALMTTRAGLLGARDLARRYGTMVTLHAAQSPKERMQCGLTGVEYLSTIGFLDSRVLAAHMVAVDPNDIRLLARHQVKIAYNPVSNMFVADGIAPVMEFATAGLCVGLGTDDCNANQSASMIADLKFAALAQKVKYGSAAAMTAEKVLEMATIDGAAALGMADLIGSIEVGKKADLCLVDLRRAHCTPCHSVPSVLVYSALGSEVDTVIVDGKVLLSDGALTFMSPEEEAALLDEAQRRSYDVLERAGMQRLRDRAWNSIP